MSRYIMFVNQFVHFLLINKMKREIILQYVYQHFAMNFEVNGSIETLFFNSEQLFFPNTGESFFNSKQPKPNVIKWKKWAAENLPLLFDSTTHNEWFELKEGKLIFNYDLPSMIFYFLSGWQEEHCTVTDKFRRFPYSESIQKEQGFVTLPVVNYYFFILQKGFEKLIQQPIPLKQQYRLNITHDIDLVNSGWKSAIKKQLLKGSLWSAVTTAYLKLVKNIDPYQNLKEIIEYEKAKKLNSTFYLIPTNDEHQGIQNADYSLNDSYIQQIINTIREEPGFELGLHTPASIQLNTKRIIEYTQALGGNISSNRFHYLALQQSDLAYFEGTGIITDSSLGFAEHIGFRHGSAWPFHPFNFDTNKAMLILEIPLMVMDATFTNSNYMNLNEKEVYTAIQKITTEVQKVNGTLTVLWHNDKFNFYKSIISKGKYL